MIALFSFFLHNLTLCVLFLLALFQTSYYSVSARIILFYLFGRRDFLTRRDPFFQQCGRLAGFEGGSRQGTSLLDRRCQTVHITSDAGIEDDGISFGIRMIASLQYGLELFGIFFRTAPLEVDQFASRNINRSGVEFEFVGFVHLGFSRGGGIFNLKGRERAKIGQSTKWVQNIASASDWDSGHQLDERINDTPFSCFCKRRLTSKILAGPRGLISSNPTP
jgi:hypothetical protein